MAYYLVSLVEILEQILHPDQHNQNWVLDPDKIPQIQSLFEHASFLRDGFATSERLSRARIESLEDRIKDMVENVEDDIVTGQILSSSCQSYKISLPDFKEEIRVFESAKQEMTDIINSSRRPTNQILDYASPVVSSRRDPNPKNMVMGVTEDLNQLRNRLIGKSSSKLEIIPIVGMGGSGKTTLARILYDEFSSSKSHFDICAWVTISQDYNPRGILQSLLDCVTGNRTIVQEIGELRDSLHKCLFSRRYFIVLDDIWSSEAWDAVQTAFPHENENKGSRIILTTRENNLPDYVQSKSHQMHLLNEDISWDLLRKKVYGEESCPRELEKIGKRIAKNCKGLPLALQVIGGLLSHAKRSNDFWEQVASDVNSCITNEDEQFSGIFSLSYAHLPHYLKPCFLYMSAFPEDYTIQASKLIKLWIVEGFICPVGDKSPEETAKIYLKMLVDRNLIFARESCVGKVKSYGIHDLLRDLCMKKAKEKKLIWVKNLRDNNLSEDTLRIRRACVHSLHDIQRIYLDKHGFSLLKLTPLARSVLCMTNDKIYPEYILSFICFDSSLLRVLDVLGISFPKFPKEILQLVNLRYLALRCRYEFPDNIYLLRNLQTLIIEDCFILRFTPGIFDIPQLRHLHFDGLGGVEGFEEFDRRSFALQEKLQSLSTVPLVMLTRLFLGKIPNLRKLGISFFPNSTDIFDLTCFNKLETLKIFSEPTSKLPNFVFPDSLKKLTLRGCTVRPTFMNTIGMLPNLEALKLQTIDFENLTWEPSEGEFCKLQYLQLHGVGLENWLADETHFPMLQHLDIEDCYDLRGIPLEIGGIATLEIIEVDEDSSTKVMDSARRIIKEQRKLGNDLLQLREISWY